MLPLVLEEGILICKGTGGVGSSSAAGLHISYKMEWYNSALVFARLGSAEPVSIVCRQSSSVLCRILSALWYTEYYSRCNYFNTDP